MKRNIKVFTSDTSEDYPEEYQFEYEETIDHDTSITIQHGLEKASLTCPVNNFKLCFTFGKKKFTLNSSEVGLLLPLLELAHKVNLIEKMKKITEEKEVSLRD